MLHVAETGSGPIVLALHGAYSTSAEVLGFLAPMLPEHRIIAPDLPGAGESISTTAGTVAEVLPLIERILDERAGDPPVAVIGHSFGAHLARGLVARNPSKYRSLTLICPLVPDDVDAEPAYVVVDDGASELLSDEERSAFEEYFVVRTRETVDAFRANVVPTIGRYDSAVVTSQLEHSKLDIALPTGADPPVSILVARRDAYVGWRQVVGLLDAYPRASAHVIADAGHALPHERPDIVGRLLELAQI